MLYLQGAAVMGASTDLAEVAPLRPHLCSIGRRVAFPEELAAVRLCLSLHDGKEGCANSNMFQGWRENPEGWGWEACSSALSILKKACMAMIDAHWLFVADGVGTLIR